MRICSSFLVILDHAVKATGIVGSAPRLRLLLLVSIMLLIDYLTDLCYRALST